MEGIMKMLSRARLCDEDCMIFDVKCFAGLLLPRYITFDCKEVSRHP